MEEATFQGLNNAILEILDRQVNTNGLLGAERSAALTQMRTTAGEVTRTLQCFVKDAVEEIKKTEYGKLKGRETELIAKLAHERQINRDMTHQLEAIKSALTQIQKMHAEEMAHRQKEYTKHFQTEVDNLTANHEAEIRRLKALTFQAGTAAGHISSQLSAVQSQYGQSESFHSAQVKRLQEEIDAHRREGNNKEAEAKLAYLNYHQQELNKIRSIVNLAGEKGSLMEEAVKSLQARYAADLEASRAAHAKTLAGEKAALQAEYRQKMVELQSDLTSAKGELATKDVQLRVAAKDAADIQAIKAQHVATVSQMKEKHREEIYLLQARQLKLQKEMSQKLDATRLNSQESIGALSGTMRRPFGSTLSRPAGTAGLTAPKWMDLSLRRPTLAPSRDPYSSHKDDELFAQLEDLDRHYEAMQAQRGPLEEYDG